MDHIHKPSERQKQKLSSEHYLRDKLSLLWIVHRSVLLMVLAQLISATMAVMAKTLQTYGSHGPPLGDRQILVTMMTVTLISSWLWMLVAKSDHVPFGPRALWGLLSARGIAGTVGIWGFYYSLRHLPVAVATVINFLAPTAAMIACGLAHSRTSTVREKLAAIASIVGVVLVVHPWAASAHTQARTSASTARSIAIAVGLLGVVGGAFAYAATTMIGERTQPVILVHHFAMWTTMITATSYLFTGFRSYRTPSTLQAAMLGSMGLLALPMNLLIAKSLQLEGGSRALNVVYIQVFFALLMDKLIWGLQPSWIGLAGGMLILGSSLAVAWSSAAQEDDQRERNLREERDLMAELEATIGCDEHKDSVHRV